MLIVNKQIRCMSKQYFNRSCNSRPILGKLLGRASDELVVHLFRVKSSPTLLHGCEVNPYACDTFKTPSELHVKSVMFK